MIFCSMYFTASLEPATGSVDAGMLSDVDDRTGDISGTVFEAAVLRFAVAAFVKKYFISNMPHSHCTYFPFARRETVVSCTPIFSAISFIFSGIKLPGPFSKKTFWCKTIWYTAAVRVLVRIFSACINWRASRSASRAKR